ncbi:MAG: hypothetical protein AMJ54_02705 [Deltaproteobacteria bacterium SG8_13]|nr:MAG: hypothetical protein AMJ54_02705 [Deltaproteobacteria bacterium SG8_13]
MAEALDTLSAQLDFLRKWYEQQIPFNRVIGLQVETLRVDFVSIRFSMREELIGNAVHGILHGGVISSVLDATGGLAAAASILEKMQGRSAEEIATRIARIGTIDLRVDFLRPGRGEFFRAKSAIMRSGNKVAVTRMEFFSNKEILIAVGTGTYIVG